MLACCVMAWVCRFLFCCTSLSWLDCETHAATGTVAAGAAAMSVGFIGVDILVSPPCVWRVRRFRLRSATAFPWQFAVAGSEPAFWRRLDAHRQCLADDGGDRVADLQRAEHGDARGVGDVDRVDAPAGR